MREPGCGAGTENIRKGCSWKILIRLKKLQKSSPAAEDDSPPAGFFSHFAERYGKIQKRKAFGEH